LPHILAFDANVEALALQAFRGAAGVRAAVEATVTAPRVTRPPAVQDFVVVVAVVFGLVANRFVGLGGRRGQERDGGTDD
jgi:hypothetical protein